MKVRWRRGIRGAGLISLVAGSILLFYTFSPLTGFSLASSNTAAEAPSLISIVFIIGGIALLMESTRDRVRVFRQTESKHHPPNLNYHITDPDSCFGSSPRGVSLAAFRKEISSISHDPELIGIVQSSYGPELLRIYDRGEPHEREVAESFLEVLYGPSYLEKRTEENLALTKEEELDIRQAFDSGWSGAPTPHQRKILAKYHLVHEARSDHGRIVYLHDPKIFRPVSSTPSDTNAGKNVGRSVIDLIYRARRGQRDIRPLK